MNDTRRQLGSLWLLVVALLWLTHAIGYLMHEYAHTVTAWLLHAKSNPLALNYGHLTLANLLYQGDIDENVDYSPLFAGGRAHAAGLIAIAGVLIGNGLSYGISRGLFRRAYRNRSRGPLLFAFLLCIMSVGNFLAYVPVRTFTTHADMFTAEKGFNVSAWFIALGLGIPFAAALIHFFLELLPRARVMIFPSSYGSQVALVVLTTYLVFGFFGSSGLHNYGNVAHTISTVCMYGLFPVSTVLCWPGRRPFYASTRP